MMKVYDWCRRVGSKNPFLEASAIQFDTTKYSTQCTDVEK